MEKEIVCSLEKEGFRAHYYPGWKETNNAMLAVFKEKNYCHRVESHIYEKGSHALADGMNEMSGFTKFLFQLMIPTEKKYPRECEEARQDSFKRIIKFIGEW